MPNSRDTMQSASRKEQGTRDMLTVVTSSLYRQVEAVLLVGGLAQETFLQVVGKPIFGGDGDKVRRHLLFVIAMMGSALENGHVTVSSTFPFSADEMVSAGTPHFKRDQERSWPQLAKPLRG